MSATTKNEPPGLQLFWKLYRENRGRLHDRAMERAKAIKLQIAMQLTSPIQGGNC